MSPANVQRFKIGLGLLLGVAIGAVCRLLHIPSPAPPVLTGALLVVSMTLGYIVTDRYCSRAAANRPHCGGPDGEIRSTRRDA
jgi:XapX domain-containing protein